MFNSKSIIKFIVLCAANISFVSCAAFVVAMFEALMHDLGQSQIVIVVGFIALISICIFMLLWLSAWVLKSWRHWIVIVPIQFAIYISIWLAFVAFRPAPLWMPLPLSIISVRFFYYSEYYKLINFAFFLIEVFGIQALALWVKQIKAKHKDLTKTKAPAVKVEAPSETVTGN